MGRFGQAAEVLGVRSPASSGFSDPLRWLTSCPVLGLIDCAVFRGCSVPLTKNSARASSGEAAAPGFASIVLPHPCLLSQPPPITDLGSSEGTQGCCIRTFSSGEVAGRLSFSFRCCKTGRGGDRQHI